MTRLVAFLDHVQALVFGGLGLAALLQWRRHRTAPAAWLAATFGSLALVVVADELVPEESTSRAVDLVERGEIALAVLFPYLLYRFMAGFEQPPRWMDAAATGLTVVVVLGALFGPQSPEEGEARSAAFGIYVLVVLVQWVLLSAVVARRLWRAGRGQPTVARRRMRTLSFGSIAMAVAIVIAGAVSGDEPPAAELATQLVAFVAATLFFFGFAPPTPLRAAWRRPEEAALREAERKLMQATEPAEVADVLLPHAAPLVGGRGSALVDENGRVMGSHGLDRDELKRMVGLEERGALRELRIPLTKGYLIVAVSTYTPFFGRDEIELLESFAALADLALARAALHASEHQARVELQRANEELESFLFSVSHDLKNPLVSILGYLDYLKSDHAAGIPPEGRRYIDRMVSIGAYMQDLIQDLLEMSRIGRVQTEPERVDTRGLVQEIATEIKLMHPRVTIDIEENVPSLFMNPARVRQLFVNLIENAVTHSGRDDVTIRIGLETARDGSVTLYVADNGRGIPAQHRDKVFNMFERLEPARGESADGTGIGLAICKKITDSVGGDIGISADAAEGAKFWITLPADAKQEVRT